MQGEDGRRRRSPFVRSTSSGSEKILSVPPEVVVPQLSIQQFTQVLAIFPDTTEPESFDLKIVFFAKDTEPIEIALTLE